MAPFEPFARERRVAVAVSGGADSMALAFLLSRWGCAQALIVDHGLRPEAPAEARLATEQLSRLGLPCRTLTLALPRGPALSARARAARYGALAAACAEAGLCDLLVGHHAQDQAETVMLRSDRGSGPAGLAGMASVSYLPQVRVLRPLLACPPERLRATLRQAGLRWSEDPSNRDPATARAALRDRIRADNATLAEARETASRMGDARRATEQRIADELGAVASMHPEGFAHLTAGAISAEALSALVWTLSGQPHPPAPAAVRRLLGPALRPGTLHGVRVTPAGRMGPGWLLVREALGAAMPARDGALWDGRFKLHGDPEPGTVIAAVGEVQAFRQASFLPASVLRTMPSLKRNGMVVAVPHLDYPDAGTCSTLRFAFEPGRSAGPAPFVRA